MLECNRPFVWLYFRAVAAVTEEYLCFCFQLSEIVHCSGEVFLATPRSVGPPRPLAGSYGGRRTAPPAACPQGQRCHLNIRHFVQLPVIAWPQRFLCIMYAGKTLCAAETDRGWGAKATFRAPPSSLLLKHIKEGGAMISSRPPPSLFRRCVRHQLPLTGSSARKSVGDVTHVTGHLFTA